MTINGFPSHVEFTPGALRALHTAFRWSPPSDSRAITPEALLLGLLGETECRAAAMLERNAITPGEVCRAWAALRETETDAPTPDWVVNHRSGIFSDELQSSIDMAIEWLVRHGQSPELASEHLLWGLVAADHAVAHWLRQHGLSAEAIENELCRLHGHLFRLDQLTEGEPIGEPIDLDESIGDFAPEPSMPPEPTVPFGEPIHAVNRLDQTSVLRVLDAAANRAREGLRVVEDYVRFFLDDKHLTDHLKRLRHELTAALEPISMQLRLAARETQADVGTEISTESETRREKPCAVLTANFCRLQESLRTLEEFAKLVDSRLGVAFEQLRYRSYTLQRAVEIACDGCERLADSRLYVLLDGQAGPEDFLVLARDLVLAEVDVIQLRDKRLDDGALLDRARMLREVTQGSRTLFVMNDRPDLALLSRADGVHVGQDELPVKQVRSLVGAGMLIGRSVHTLEQARAAVLDGVNYLGVGPTFPSDTKQFADFPGPQLLAAVAAEISLPAFAIGGINPDNVSQVLATGIRRIAVSSAVIASDNPAAAVAQLKAFLRG